MNRSMMKYAGRTLIVLCLGFVLAACGGSPSGKKDTRKLVVNSFGGSYEQSQSRVLFGPFEEKFDAKVELPALYSAEALAKLRAEKVAPTLDLVHFSGGQEYQAAAEGLIAKVDRSIVTNMDDLHPLAMQGDYAPAYAFAVMAIIYNEEKVEPAPDSWEVLWDPKYKGKVAIPDLSVTYGVQLLLQSAVMEGGDEHNVDPGFEKLERLVPNLHSVYRDATTMMQLLSQEEVWLAVYDVGYGYALQQQGVPVKFVVPNEGSYLQKVVLSVVNGTDQPELAQELVNFALDPDVQAQFAVEAGYVPVNQKVKLPDSAADVLPSPEVMDKLRVMNEGLVNTSRPQWTERWNRMIAQ